MTLRRVTRRCWICCPVWLRRLATCFILTTLPTHDARCAGLHQTSACRAAFTVPADAVSLPAFVWRSYCVGFQLTYHPRLPAAMVRGPSAIPGEWCLYGHTTRLYAFGGWCRRRVRHYHRRLLTLPHPTSPPLRLPQAEGTTYSSTNKPTATTARHYWLTRHARQLCGRTDAIL